MKEKSNTSKYLKYRQKHTVKAILDFQWKRLTLGTNIVWKSKTLAVDYLMVDERTKEQPEIMDFIPIGRKTTRPTVWSTCVQA